MALWVAWRPIVRDEESADGYPGPQQTSGGPLLFFGLAFLDVHVGGGASVPRSSHFISWCTGLGLSILVLGMATPVTESSSSSPGG